MRPDWINTEELNKDYDEMMALAKDIRAFCVIAEEKNTLYFLLELEEEEISSEIFDKVYRFNNGGKRLLCDVVLSHQNVKGERYVINI